MQPGQGFHIIRDHPHHQHLILGGLWGARGGILPNITELVDEYLSTIAIDYYGADIRFLSRVVSPIVASNSFIHSDFVAFADELVNPIPALRHDFQWLGFPSARGNISENRLLDFKRLENQGLRRYEITEAVYG